jgi:phage-related protein
VGLLEAIGGLFSSPVKLVEDLAHKAWSGIKSVFIFASSVFDLVGGAWDWMVNGIGWVGNNLIGFAARVLHLLEYAILHLLPDGLKWVYGQAVGWARKAIAVVERALQTALKAAVHWLTGVIRSVENWAKGAVKHVWQTLTGVFNWVERVGKQVGDLVLHPERLAAWLGGHVIEPLVKWMVSNSAGLIVWLFKRALGLLPTLAHTFEEALEKLI